MTTDKNTVSIRLTTEAKKRLKIIAAQTDSNLSDTITRLIDIEYERLTGGKP